MFSGFLVTLREGLEAFLIICILAGYLIRTGHRKEVKLVWLGAGAALAVSLIVMGILSYLGLTLGHDAREMFEAVMMIIAVVIVSTMILWMHHHAKFVRTELQNRLSQAVSSGQMAAIALLSFTMVVREGIETSIFLTALSSAGPEGGVFTGALLGFMVAAVFGHFFFHGSMNLNLRVFFSVTGWLLILFAAGMISRAAGIFVELGYLPSLIEPVWDTGWLLNDGSITGTLLRTLFGYTARPSLLQVLAQMGYILGMGLVFKWGVPRRPMRIITLH